jgi:hypothetical protein
LKKKEKKTPAANHWCQLYKSLFLKKLIEKWPYFVEKKVQMSPYLDSELLTIGLPELGRIPKAILLYSLSCSQI